MKRIQSITAVNLSDNERGIKRKQDFNQSNGSASSSILAFLSRDSKPTISVLYLPKILEQKEL